MIEFRYLQLGALTLLILTLFLFLANKIAAKTAVPFLYSQYFKKEEEGNPYQIFRKIIFVIILVLLIILASRPARRETSKSEKEVIDVYIALDLTKSMNQSDVIPTRLEAAKSAIIQFLNMVKNYPFRVGLVSFMNYAIMEVPLTSDFNILEQKVKEISSATFPYYYVDIGGTNISAPILLTTSYFQERDKNEKNKYSEKKPLRVLILVTDGEHSSKNIISPIEAAQLALESNIKIYLIKIKSQKVKDTEDLLYSFKDYSNELTQITGGKVFKPETLNQMENVMKEIANSEKVKITKQNFSILIDCPDLFITFLLLATFLFFNSSYMVYFKKK